MYRILYQSDNDNESENEGESENESDTDIQNTMDNFNILWKGRTTVVIHDKNLNSESIGKGLDETYDPRYTFEDIDYYGWRRTLSINIPSLFELDNMYWNSVSCYYHANKFKKTKPEWYKKLSDTPFLYLKKFCNDHKQYQDPYFDDYKNTILYKGNLAKFIENKQLAEILIKTYPAKLLLKKYNILIPALELMKVRLYLINNKNYYFINQKIETNLK